MKRLAIILLVCFFSLRSFSQELTWDQKFDALNAVDSIVNAYEGLLTFTDLNNFDSISNESLSKFRSLFASDASIYDDLCPAIFVNNYKDPLIFSEKAVDDFLTSVKKNYPKGLISAKITNMNVAYADMASQRAVYVALEKRVTATTRAVGTDLNSGLSKNKWSVEVLDTVVLTIELSKDFKTAEIKKISHDGVSVPNFKVMNDEDNDFVIDGEDNCRGFKGFITYNGCDYPQGPLLTALVIGGPGATLGNSFKDFGQNSPDGYDVNYGSGLKSKEVGLGGSIAAQFELFVDRRRHFGIGIGATLFRTSNVLSIDNFQAIYKSTKPDPGGKYFTQEVSSEGKVQEKLSFYSLTPAFYFKYKTKFSQSAKWGIKLNGGVGYRIQFKPTITVQEGVFNYEATYSNNTSDPNDDILFTDAFIKQYDVNSTIIKTLDSLRYNVRLQQHAMDSKLKKENLKNGFTLILEPGFTYQWSKNFYLNFGLQILYDLPITNNKSWGDNNYMLTDQKDEYNTLLAGVRSVKNTYVGLTVGISFSLIKGYKDFDVY